MLEGKIYVGLIDSGRSKDDDKRFNAISKIRYKNKIIIDTADNSWQFSRRFKIYDKYDLMIIHDRDCSTRAMSNIEKIWKKNTKVVCVTHFDDIGSGHHYPFRGTKSSFQKVSLYGTLNMVSFPTIDYSDIILNIIKKELNCLDENLDFKK